MAIHKAKDLLIKLHNIINFSKDKSDELSKDFVLDHTDPRIAIFNMVYNHSEKIARVIEVYIQQQDVEIVRTKNEFEKERRLYNTEVWLNQTRYLFSVTFSIIEYNLKNLINNPQNPLYDCLDRKKRLIDLFNIPYDLLRGNDKEKFSEFVKLLKETPKFDSFSKIIEKSNSMGLIGPKNKKGWNFVIKLRNIGVHNNFIADELLEINYREINYKLLKKERVRGQLDYLIMMTMLLLELTYDWILNYNKKNL